MTTELYNNASGTTGTVTLNESAANFEYLEIYYKGYQNLYDCIGIASPNGKTANLKNIFCDYNAVMAVMMCNVAINGTSITHSAGEFSWANTTGYYKETTNHFSITKVIGYR